MSAVALHGYRRDGLAMLDLRAGPCQFRPMSQPSQRSPVDPSAILFKGVGTWDAIAIAVAGMAPTMAMNLNPQEPAEHVGRVVPLVFALSTLVVLTVAWCFARLAHHHPNAGSAYGFVAAILGPRLGLVAGWTLLGTYLCFATVGLAAVGLFGANLLQRLDLWRDASGFVLALMAGALVAPLSIIPARRAGLVLIILEGVAVVAMLVMACAVLWLVARGHGPQGDPPLRDLFVPTAGVGASAIALGLSFGLLSFAGFEQVATLGEEVKKSRFTIPRVLIGTVLGAGVVFTLVTAAQTLGFGTDKGGVHLFTTSTSLLADLAARYFGGWSGDLFDALAIASALGGTLAAIVAASRILFALGRDLAPTSALARVSPASGTPRNAAVCVVVVSIAGYAAMRLGFGASGSDAFFWGSTLGALGLLVAYFLVVASAGGAVLRASENEPRWMLLIPALAAVAIAYTLWVNVYPPQPGAYQVIPWIVLAWCCAPLAVGLLSPRLLELVTAGFLAAHARTKED
jgi:amino acid transporter